MFTSSKSTLLPKESVTLFTEIIAHKKLRREGTILKLFLRQIKVKNKLLAM